MQGAHDQDQPQFKQATVKEIYKLVLDNNTRVSAPALHLSAEYLRLFATEAVHRSAEVAKKGQEDGEEVMLLEPKHLEKVIAGLLLDF
ncbi:hypothetical protein JCM8547_009269 [Rhodosporidiobolus lusitaniae]